MGYRKYRHRRKIEINKWRKLKRIHTSVDNTEKEIKHPEEIIYDSYYKSIPNGGAIDHIRGRVLKNRFRDQEKKHYGEIMFGFATSGKPDYYVLKIEETECGYVPTKLSNGNKIQIDLFPLLNLDNNNPCEPIFDLLAHHFQEKGSSLTANSLEDFYIQMKKFMVEHGADKDTVYFLEQEKGIPYPN